MMEEGGFLYSADAYADDLPYWLDGPKGPQLIVPYTLDANDMRFATPQGFNAGDQFFAYLKDTFDMLYAEGETAPKMLSIGLHCRLVGRPGRAAALARFLDYVRSHEPRLGRDAARHRPPLDQASPAGRRLRPSAVPKALFVEVFGRVWENSPWVAEAAYEAGLTTARGQRRRPACRDGEGDARSDARAAARPAARPIPILPASSPPPRS